MLVLAALVALGGMALTAWRPVLGAALLVVSAPLTGGLGRDTVLPFLRPSEAATIVVAVGLVLHLLPRRLRRTYSVLDIVVGAFGAVAVLVPTFVVILGDTSIDIGLARSLLAPAQYLVLYLIFSRVPYADADLCTLLNLALGASVIVALVGIAQLADLPGVRDFIDATYLRGGTEICQYGVCRPTSLLEHWSAFGAYAVMHYAIALAVLVHRLPQFSPRWLMVVMILNAVAAVTSQTQAAVIGLVLATIIILRHGRHVPRQLGYAFVPIALGVALFWPFLSARVEQQLGGNSGQGIVTPESLQVRERYWTELFVPALTPHLWFGTGTLIPTTVPERLETFVDNEYLRMGFRAGIVGVAALVGLLATVAVFGASYRGRGPGDPWRAVGTSALTFAVVLGVIGVAADYTTYVGVAQPLWMMTGLFGATALAARSGPVRVARSPEFVHVLRPA